MTSSDHSPPKAGLAAAKESQSRRSSNSLLSLFRTSFSSWLPSSGSITTTTTTTTKPKANTSTTTTIAPSKSLSLWTRLRSPSLPTLSSRDTEKLRHTHAKEELRHDKDKLRKLKKVLKRDKTARMWDKTTRVLKTSASVGSLSLAPPSITTCSSSSSSSSSMFSDPSEKVNKGGMRISSLKIIPLEERVYVIDADDDPGELR